VTQGVDSDREKNKNKEGGGQYTPSNMKGTVVQFSNRNFGVTTARGLCVRCKPLIQTNIRGHLQKHLAPVK